ncbi:MAG: hypothetical protein IIY34_07755 [Clostridia bacterium]|nr:hypothetical protein [Clostridia bacterium]
MKKLTSILLCVMLVLTLMPAAFAADETYTLTLYYDDSLCTCTVYDETSMQNDSPTVLKKGSGSVDLPKDTAIALKISNIKKGYRIQEVRVNTYFDRTYDFLRQSKTSGAMSLGTVSSDFYVQIELEPIPEELPVLEGAGIYFDENMVYPAAQNIGYEDEPNLALLGEGIYSDGEQHPAYYADGHWQYSVDGETWYDNDLTGPYVFLIPDAPIEIDPETDAYDLRYVMSPNEDYCTGETVYSDVIHINSGTSHIEYDENGLPMLDEPFGLKWGEMWGGEPFPGYVSHLIPRRNQGVYRIAVYREIEGEEPEEIDWSDFSGANDHIYDVFVPDFEESGDYYFTAVTVGDYTEYADSRAAVSETWHFDAPEERLDAPYGLFWSYEDGEYTMNWDYDETELAGGTDTVILFAPDLDTEPIFAGEVGTAGKLTFKDTNSDLPDFYIEENGAGYYYFKVRLFSSDITTALCSDFSEMSEPMFISDVSMELNTIMDALSEESTPEEIEDAIAQVREIDTDELAACMAADKYDEQAAGNIGWLEQMSGKVPDIVVTDAMSETISEGAVDIIGAGLNADAGQKLVFKIDEAQSTHVLPLMYKNTVSFSMDVVDAETNESVLGDRDELSVPVKVTLPVPQGINIDFLDILHHRADGTTEHIQPYRDRENGTVTFVLTHFSDFAFAERAPASMDVTLDGTTLSYDITLPEGENADFIVALYDENGAMTESRVVKITSSVSDSMTLPEANEYKAFLLLDGVPLAEAWSSAPGMILR